MNCEPAAKLARRLKLSSCLAAVLPRGRASAKSATSRRRGCESYGETMKFVMAVIKPFKLDEVRDALSALGVQGLTVSEVKGYGRQKGQSEIYRGAEYAVHFVPKLKLEVAVDDALAPQVIETIQSVASTGQIGDGKVFVLDLEQALRIRTGETGADAL